MTHRGTHRLSGLILVVLVAVLFSLAFVSVAQAQAGGPVVTTLNDDGPGSLRNAVLIAASGDTVTFDPALSGTITLLSRIDINKNLTIAGAGKGKTTISGGHTVGVFEIAAGNAVTINCLTIRDHEARRKRVDNRRRRCVSSSNCSRAARCRVSMSTWSGDLPRRAARSAITRLLA